MSRSIIAGIAFALLTGAAVAGAIDTTARPWPSAPKVSSAGVAPYAEGRSAYQLPAQGRLPRTRAQTR